MGQKSNKDNIKITIEINVLDNRQVYKNYKLLSITSLIGALVLTYLITFHKLAIHKLRNYLETKVPTPSSNVHLRWILTILSGPFLSYSSSRVAVLIHHCLLNVYI